MSIAFEELWLAKLQGFVFYLTRIAGLVLVAPIFSSPRLPARVKISVIFLITLVVYLPAMHRFNLAIPWGWPVVFGLLRETAVGLVLGFTVALIFSAFGMAGELIGLEMGLGMSRILDPLNGNTTDLLGQFFQFMSFLLFLALDGHHWIVAGLARSFVGIPVGSFPDPTLTATTLVTQFAMIVEAATRLAVPALILLFISSAGIAVLSKTVPQIHLLDMGFPLRILTGMVILIALLPYMLPIMRGVLWQAQAALFHVASP
jgi:flagellar biosynthetic protein FliR